MCLGVGIAMLPILVIPLLRVNFVPVFLQYFQNKHSYSLIFIDEFNR